jgi:hypothetical protein
MATERRNSWNDDREEEQLEAPEGGTTGALGGGGAGILR